MPRVMNGVKVVRSRLACAFILACALTFLPAFGGMAALPGETTAKAASDSSKATGASYKQPQKVFIPTMEASDATAIDTTGLSAGYVGASAKSSSRLKFQVNCGDMTYNYDLPSDGTPTYYPLNMGDGEYGFRIMQNIEGTSYAELDSTYEKVKLDSEFGPFLAPNIYCSYEAGSDCVKKALSITKSCKNEGEVVREVCTYVADHITYDYDKAKVLAKSSGYIPDPDATLKEGKGICFDYAALSAAMLRCLGIPAQVVTGYVSPDNLYHAWTMVYIDGSWKSALFSISPKKWSRCDVTFAAAGASSVTGSGTDYTDRFIF